jgi:hypothetical protein
LKIAVPENVQAVTARLVQSAMRGHAAGLSFDAAIDDVRGLMSSGAERVARTASKVAVPFGPDHFETQCGFKVRGGRLENFEASPAFVQGQIFDQSVLRIDLNSPAASVLLRFEGNIGTVLPAIRGFVGAITMEEGEIVDVSYEPSANTPRWSEYQQRALEVRALRAAASAATEHGRFRLTADDSASIARRMQYAKGVDPTLAVYAAYAYHDLQLIDRIREMTEFMNQDLGVVLFDLRLLARQMVGQAFPSLRATVPFVPLFSQGWALLHANRVRLHPALDGIERTMQESTWSLFNSQGLDMLAKAIHSGEVI